LVRAPMDPRHSAPGTFTGYAFTSLDLMAILGRGFDPSSSFKASTQAVNLEKTCVTKILELSTWLCHRPRSSRRSFCAFQVVTAANERRRLKYVLVNVK
jgi:hypothetical protein